MGNIISAGDRYMEKFRLKMLTEVDRASALVVGASQGIGLGFVKSLLKQEHLTTIYATYRQRETADELFELQESSSKLKCLQVDITKEAQIAAAASQIKESSQPLHLAIYCVGLLHEGELTPEKSLRQINSENLVNYFQVNSIGAILLAKHLMPVFKKQESVFACISAKVGSIGDNRLGGWYGYRASKAALNMFLKTTAIEYSRRCPKTRVLSLHPGTTDTRLSAPFQKNVPPGKLFPVEHTVNLLLKVIEQTTIKDSGKFFSWDGSELPW